MSNDNNGWRIGDAGRTVFGPKNGNPSPETIATLGRNFRVNGPLIATAPELLAALKKADYALSFHFGHDAKTGNWGNILRSDIRAAIAKAEVSK